VSPPFNNLPTVSGNTVGIGKLSVIDGLLYGTAFRNGDPKGIWCYISDDFGASWTNQGEVTQLTSFYTSPGYNESRSHIVKDGDGVLWTAHRFQHTSTDYHLNLYYSNDNGATWQGATGNPQYSYTAAQGGTSEAWGEPDVCYLKATNTLVMSAGGYAAVNMRIKKSSPPGQNWDSWRSVIAEHFQCPTLNNIDGVIYSMGRSYPSDGDQYLPTLYRSLSAGERWSNKYLVTGKIGYTNPTGDLEESLYGDVYTDDTRTFFTVWSIGDVNNKDTTSSFANVYSRPFTWPQLSLAGLSFGNGQLWVSEE
jgi:hypothetical protein